MSINKITRESHPDQFDEFIDDSVENSYQEHRRGSNFWTRSIHEINEKYFPDFPELWGYWETNTYIWDDNYGRNRNEITELNRVVQQEKVIKTTEWVKV